MSYEDKLYVQNVNSFSHLLDRLTVENIKLADFVRRMEIEQSRDKEDLEAINRLYKGLRLANEARAAVKNKLDQLLSDVMKAGCYHVLSEQRTFRLPTDSNNDDIVTREDPGAEFHESKHMKDAQRSDKKDPDLPDNSNVIFKGGK